LTVVKEICVTRAQDAPIRFRKNFWELGAHLMNISSVIVILHPERVAAVRARLAALPGVEVHAVSPQGKIIVTIETASDRDTAERYETISLLDDVMSAAMVYHQKEDEPEKIISVESSPNGEAAALA
jgi:nitrate reductase NapD